MCIFSTDVLRFLKNETYFYLQAKKKVGEIPLTFFYNSALLASPEHYRVSITLQYVLIYGN